MTRRVVRVESENGYWRPARRLTRRRTLASWGTVAGGVVLASACGGHGRQQPAATQGTGASNTPKPGGTLSYYLVANPPTLDPQRTVGSATQQIAGAVYNRLFRFKTAHDASVVEARDPRKRPGNQCRVA